MPTLSVETDIGVSTRDGVTLATTLFRPAGPGRWPAILMRTPYERTTYASETLQVHATALAASGYAVVLQDVRGRGASKGRFSPFVHERSDGIDTIEWVVAQPWCNGELGLAGISYNAFAQTSIAHHEAVRCWMPGLAPSDVRTSWIRRNGILDLGFHLSWALGSIAPRDARTTDAEGVLAAFENPVATARRGTTDQPELRSTPAADWFFEWVDRYDPYPGIEAVPTLAGISSITTPALVVAGWYDVFSSGSIELFEALQRGRSSGAHRLVAGPWDHSGLPLGRRVGDRDFGLSAVFDLHDLQLRWLDQHLRGGEEVAGDRLFVTGRNRWLSGVTWPLSAESFVLHLNPEGDLSPDPGRAGSVGVTLDPANPTPPAGGTTFPWEPALRPGAFDQSARHTRSDVLVFSGQELDSPLLVAGEPRIELRVEVPAEDTPVVVTLFELEPRGRAWNVSDGFGRVDPATGVARFDLGPICHRFAKGSRLGLDVAFSADARLAPAGAGPCVIDFSQGPASMTIPVMV